MSTIGIKCVDQVMTFTNMPVITAGDQNVDKVQFDFCPLWDGFVKVAVFFQQKSECSYALINADGSCNIPNSILQLSGKIFIAVTGTNTSNQARTSNILSYHVDEGIVDASLQDEFPSDITEEEKNDVYNKMLDMCVEMQNLCQDLIGNFAYVRVDGVNTFEYDESALEAKIRAYTYPKDNLYTKAETYSRQEVDAIITQKVKGDFATIEIKADTTNTIGFQFNLPEGFTRDNCFLVGSKHGEGRSQDEADSPNYIEFTDYNGFDVYTSDGATTVSNAGISIIMRNTGVNEITIRAGGGNYHNIKLLFMKF